MSSSLLLTGSMNCIEKTHLSLSLGLSIISMSRGMPGASEENGHDMSIVNSGMVMVVESVSVRGTGHCQLLKRHVHIYSWEINNGGIPYSHL